MQYYVLLGRIFYSALFILASLGHFSEHAVSYAENHGVPMAHVLVPLSGVIALLGGLSILVGYKAQFGACLLVIFLLPITFMMHKFWEAPDQLTYTIEQAMFMKNLALLGAALLIMHFGSGPLSFDET